MPQGMGRRQNGRPGSSAGALGIVLAVDRGLDWEVRNVSRMGSLRRNKGCEGGDGGDGELHLWCLQRFLSIVCV